MVFQGGDTIKQKTVHILKSIRSWDVAKQFSWYGAKGKMKFCEQNVSKLLWSKSSATILSLSLSALSWLIFLAPLILISLCSLPDRKYQAESEGGYIEKHWKSSHALVPPCRRPDSSRTAKATKTTEQNFRRGRRSPHFLRQCTLITAQLCNKYFWWLLPDAFIFVSWFQKHWVDFT